MALKIIQLTAEEKAELAAKRKAEAQASHAASTKKKTTKKSKGNKLTGSKRKSQRIGKSWICGIEIGSLVKERFDNTIEEVVKVEVITINNIPNVEVLYFKSSPDFPSVASHYTTYKKNSSNPTPPKVEGDSINIDDIPF